MIVLCSTKRSRGCGLATALGDLDWIDRVLLGKARVPSVLAQDGFIRAVLREANLLKKEVGVVAGSGEFRRLMLRATGIDWRGATASERDRAIAELSNLIQGMPSGFLPGVEVVLDEQGRRVVQDAHRTLGKKFKRFSVDPVFALKNEKAIRAIRDTTSIFFSPEYERQANRFTRRAQDTVAQGLEEGLGRRGIARELRREFNAAAIHENYWETVAAVHVNRARSFSSVATYAENGVTQYEIVAVGDDRTTLICLDLDGKIFSVESALNSFDALEDANSLEVVRDQVMPFLRVRGSEIVLPDGTRTATINPRGGFSSTLSGEQLNELNVNTPPYHWRCRTTLAPVL